MRQHDLHITAQFIDIIFYIYIHAEPNPPTNLSATMTCGSQGYQVYIEWEVYQQQ